MINEKGEPVLRSTIETNSLGTAASVKGQFTVGQQEDAVQLGRESTRAAKEASEIRRRMQQLVKLGRQMAYLRGDRHDLAKSAKCGDLMRNRQAQTRELEARAKQLPAEDGQQLVGVSGLLELCVSCSQGLAPDACDAVDETLREIRSHP